MVNLASEEEEEDGGDNINRLRDTAGEAALPSPASLAVSKATSRSRRRPRKALNRGK
ncbi:hypothetical protein AtNW77_Chr1g0004291 [Arabidopsis thaliana]|jgi:hypothetical protein|uniref:Uncharacterized protein n=3 Tax=Arabidopsis TaxID=3701 RepID=A8MRV2_ARATH|nr:uncharacterized protein AT1G04778 [Arabidopsis thaliana]KAG7595843.1 hypothetical protein ISN44_As06g003870 [Arabidopsis suecica]AEE27742.1 hypothetical protein AT1G04778 [Arabidopsis thaliana]OAP12630.1 hypothetical protein AXX17_AT1G04100 [Arabidopsis thaliana]CAA0165166.1 unnamed protein product [Arabidopsis thaliana]CAD5311752.1 unnamed protein product [Arabidopsis thaliana]|eukprot:NP_001077458.1 hypothetical protein AT1G04778 [Arabidopsis thaliana]